MVTIDEINRIRNLASRGKSVNFISEKLGLPKSTTYYHFKKEVGQKQKSNRIKIPDNKEQVGEICGTVAGDGNIRVREDGHYRIRIFLNESDQYWEILAEYLQIVLGKRPRIYIKSEKSRAVLDYYSKILYDLIKRWLHWEKGNKTETINLKQDEISPEFETGFLRGLIDTDGHRSSNYKRYFYGSISKKLRNDFSNLLDNLDIEHTNYEEKPRKKNWRKMYRLRISGQEAEKFDNQINPRHPKKKL